MLLALALNVVPSFSLGAAALLVVLMVLLALVVADARLGRAAPGCVFATVVEEAASFDVLVVGFRVGKGVDRVHGDESADEEAGEKHVDGRVFEWFAWLFVVLS